jgi:hypothetical protein
VIQSPSLLYSATLGKWQDPVPRVAEYGNPGLRDTTPLGLQLGYQFWEGFSSDFFSSFAGLGSGTSTPSTYFENQAYSRRILSNR